MTEYTPTTDEVRRAGYLTAPVVSRDAFDRWLAAHDAEVAANALREAADECPPRTTMSTLTVRKHLRDRADRIEREVADRKPDPKEAPRG